MRDFDAAAKERQAYFRATSPTIRGEGRSRNQPHHVLASGYEEENLFPTIRGQNGAREFFNIRRIKWDNPLNMASSQIACVNFLLPLASIEGALATVVRAIDDDVESIIPISYKGTVSPVEFEWIGLEYSLERKTTRGANTTSVDAFMIASTNVGRRAYLIEWKYKEQYLSTKPNWRGDGYRHAKQLKGYADLYSSSFNESIPMNELLYDPFDQIMRNRFLADRIVAKGELGVSDAKVVVVVPEGNRAYRTVAYGRKTTSPPLHERFPDLKTVDEVMRATLKNPDAAFKMVTPTELREAVESECGDAVSDWAEYIRERYGW
ncbi:MAG: hypothetical protein OXK79_08370 [Chloroflexota bacterium]|nr:hypothetical protein [Chloroflexota bacterium]